MLELINRIELVKDPCAPTKAEIANSDHKKQGTTTQLKVTRLTQITRWSGPNVSILMLIKTQVPIPFASKLSTLCHWLWRHYALNCMTAATFFPSKQLHTLTHWPNNILRLPFAWSRVILASSCIFNNGLIILQLVLNTKYDYNIRIPFRIYLEET